MSNQNTPIKNQSIDSLKALVYDLSKQRQQIDQTIAKLENEIRLKSNAPAAITPDTTEEKPSEEEKVENNK
jgi:hypothetical protein